MDSKKTSGITYASEADLINIALFGITAKEWRAQNPDLKGNMRDHATIEQLVMIINLQSLNAELIKDGLGQDERLQRLNEAAIDQMRSILDSASTSKLLQFE